MNNYLRTGYLGLLSIALLAPAISAAEDSVTSLQMLRNSSDDRMRQEIVADWILQDKVVRDDGQGETLDVEAVGRVVGDLEPEGGKLTTELRSLAEAKTPPSDPRWAKLYLDACQQRRAARFQPHRDKLRRIVFTKHYDLGGSHYAYTEGQSDAQDERHFHPGSALCVLEMDGVHGRVRTLIDDPKGVIRDPDVSYDGKRILFAWKKSDREDDYHLYEMNVESGEIRQLTSGLGYADYEGAYLPSGDIVFTSTRCVQIVDCWWTEVSNLFTCDPDGKHLRQLGFDQVHDNYPTVTHDGRVLYTRWDYNDRGQIYPQGLFQMYQDGTGQTECYGNNSFFPTTVLHARSIPETGKLLCVFSGHHTRQYGLLGILEPRKGRQENQGAQLIAPVRDTPAVHVDAYGRNDPQQYQYPYPLSETDYLVTYKFVPQKKNFAVYFMTIDGGRELLVSDPKISCNQSVPLGPRPAPLERPSMVDYRKKTGTIYLQDVYAGPGLDGVAPGAIKQLRVVALDFRAAGAGHNGNNGPAGNALVSTPISIQGAWDVKKVLGTAKVHDDGSACFRVPARTPMYFQALDEHGQMVQSMRSWMSVQPGESVSCVGCHENKNSAPPTAGPTLAMAAGPQRLEPFYGPARGFSFIQEIQPILDKHCVKCHHLDESPKYGKAAAKPGATGYDPKQLRTLVPHKNATWRYTFTKPDGNWRDAGYDDSQWAYGQGGFGTKGTPGAVVGTEWKTGEIWIRRTFELADDVKIVAPQLVVHHDEDVEIYINGKPAARVTGYAKEYRLTAIDDKAAAALKTGKNTLAVHCRQTGGGQFVDVGMVDVKTGEAPAAEVVEKSKPTTDVKPAFSLRGIQTVDTRALRKWSDSYQALANRNVCNWINVQSAPPMLPPYHAGASRSKLITMLRKGHNGVRLSRAELDRFITWIDLLVPYVGDYTEAMADNGLEKYNHFLDKRRRWHAEEAENIAEYLRERK